MSAQPVCSNPPILSLSSDSLNIIFAKVCGERSNATLTLCAVCQQWRDVVRSSPHLWSTIGLKLSPKRSVVQVELLDLWLTKSQGYPLSIYFDVDVADREYPWCGADGLAAAPLKKLVDHCKRWERLSLCKFDDRGGEFRKVLKRVRGHVPLLRTLRLNRLGRHGVIDSDSLLDMGMFAIAPNPTALEISMEFYSLCDISLPWSQLTSVHARHLVIDDCIEILSYCPNLARCRFSEVRRNLFIPPFTSAHVVMEHLTKVEVIDIDEEEILRYLERLRCPALSELNLVIKMTSTDGRNAETAYNLGDSLWSSVGDFLQRSNCPLEILELSGTILTKSISEMLKKLPTLKMLRLTDKGRTAQIFENESGSLVSLLETLDIFDSGTNTHQTYLPQLKEFHYSGPDKFSATIRLHMILNTLNGRWYVPVAGVTRLEVFTARLRMPYDGDNIPSGEVMKGFKDLKAEGMKISIKNRRGEVLDKNF